MDLIEGSLRLVAVIVFLACLGSIGELLKALEKRERDPQRGLNFDKRNGAIMYRLAEMDFSH